MSQPDTKGSASTLLGAVGATVNLCVHRVLREPDPGDRYAVTTDWFGVLVGLLRRDGLAPFVGLYFDDGHDSFMNNVLPWLDVPEWHKVAVAVPTGTIGSPGRMGLGQLEEAAVAGVQVLPHGRDHVRLASYGDAGTVLPTPDGGPYGPPGKETPLTANQVLYQLSESADDLVSFSPTEFVLPYGCYNRTTLGLNSRWRIYDRLATTDFALDRGQHLVPRLIVDFGMDPDDVLGLVVGLCMGTSG